MRFYAFTIIIFLFAGLTSGYASPLLIAVEDSADPWSYKDGTGYANDVIKEAFGAVGVEVKFKVVPYVRCKRMVIGGEVVACFSMSSEPGLEKAVIFSDMPLFIVQFEYYYNKQRPIKAKREEDMPKGTIIGIVNDYEYPESAMKLKEKGIIFEVARDEETNLKKLATSRIDAALFTQNEIKPVSAIINKADVKSIVKFLFRSSAMGSYIGFSKKNPQGEYARIKFNEGFRIIKNNGTLNRINAKWRSGSPAKIIQ